jgi:hypothetical protein
MSPGCAEVDGTRPAHAAEGGNDATVQDHTFAELYQRHAVRGECVGDVPQVGIIESCQGDGGAA